MLESPTVMSTLGPKDVQLVARLARIRLEPAELETFVSQLDAILTYVQQLQRLDTERVDPTSHVLPLSNVMRPDQQQPSLPPEQVLAIAPARHGQLVKVPKIVET